MENILLSVLVVLLLVGVLIYLSLTILILNKKLKLEDPMFFFLLGNGFRLVLCSVLCRALQSS